MQCVCGDARVAVRSFADLLEDPVPARVVVLRTCLGLAVTLDVAALYASVGKSVVS